MIAQKTVQIDFAEIQFFENYVITRIYEGTCLDNEQLEKLDELLTPHFKNRPYVYISDRSQDYNVNPIAYMNYPFSDYLRGVAIVTVGDIKIENAKFEKKFMTKPFRIFSDFEKAIAWVDEIVL